MVTSTSYYSTGLVWQATQVQPVAVRLQSGSSNSSTTYAVAVEDLGLDDHGNFLSNATPVALGVPAMGRLELSSDVDTFSFTGTVGRILQIVAAPAGGSPLNLEFHMRVITPVGLVLEGTTTLGLPIEAAGTYVVQVERHGSPTATDLVNYSLTVIDQGVDDHAGMSTGATSLTLGSPASGTLQYAADVDAFSFSGLTNHVYLVSCTRTSATCNVTV